jgi:predicted ATPase
LCWRAWAQWALGYPDAARGDTSQALEIAREMGHAATSMYALSHTSLTLVFCGDYVVAETLIDQLVALADEKRTLFWKGYGLLLRGWIFALTGKAADAIDMMNAGIAASRSTGATAYAPWYLANLAKVHAELGRFDEATRCIGEAIATADTTGEKWCEADIHRIAGEIALLPPAPGVPRAEAHLERALIVARQQQAKSFELRAAMSLARLWREQGKRRQALDLLAPVYAWFSEGLDTRDLRQAKALQDELAS